MAIAGRRWITNVAPWSCIATSTGRSFGVRCELLRHPGRRFRFLKAAGHPGLQGIGSGITI